MRFGRAGGRGEEWWIAAAAVIVAGVVAWTISTGALLPGARGAGQQPALTSGPTTPRLSIARPQSGEATTVTMLAMMGNE